VTYAEAGLDIEATTAVQVVGSGEFKGDYARMVVNRRFDVGDRRHVANIVVIVS